MTLGRRAALGSAASLAAGAALTGCTGHDTGHDAGSAARATVRRPGERITLTFWSWVPGIDKPVALWNSLHPEVRVEVEKVSAVGGAQYAKMHAAITAGNPPDLGQLEYAVVPGFLLAGGLAELGQYGAGRHKAAFIGWQWQQSVFAGGVYAIPQDSGPMGLFVRQDLLDAWDIAVPTTWDEYEEAARAVRRRGAHIETFAPTNGNRFAGYAWQAGARWFAARDGTWVVHIDDEPTRRVADLWEGLVRRKLVKTVPDRQNAWYKDIQTGGIVSWLGASWGDALLAGNAPATAGAWRVAPLPQWRKGENAHANWGGSTTAVFRRTRYPRDALDFAVWLNSDPRSLQLMIKGGYGFPSARSGYASGDLAARRAFFGGQDYSRVFAAAGRAVDTSWTWGPAVDTLYQRLGDAFTEAIDEGTSFRRVLTTVQRQTLDDLALKGLKAEAG
ncbi:ABC transporter substrate-binding protein [Streptomyces sp. URMC 123]|uniref:ABC transporter substrate-binding protein n=1 Tax=Streptomyces sp. URMC 123 TaxID=3423403 RepID=UPI003F1DB42B